MQRVSSQAQKAVERCRRAVRTRRKKRKISVFVHFDSCGEFRTFPPPISDISPKLWKTLWELCKTLLLSAKFEAVFVFGLWKTRKISCQGVLGRFFIFCALNNDMLYAARVVVDSLRWNK